jgi:hypothetical protein
MPEQSRFPNLPRAGQQDGFTVMCSALNDWFNMPDNRIQNTHLDKSKVQLYFNQ